MISFILSFDTNNVVVPKPSTFVWVPESAAEAATVKQSSNDTLSTKVKEMLIKNELFYSIKHQEILQIE